MSFGMNSSHAGVLNTACMCTRLFNKIFFFHAINLERSRPFLNQASVALYTYTIHGENIRSEFTQVRLCYASLSLKHTHTHRYKHAHHTQENMFFNVAM